MISRLRSFSGSKLAGVVVGIIIIPFVFWGMGSVFSGGNTNNIAKINNESISTQDFVDHLNRLGLDNAKLKKEIDNNILEEILLELVNNKILDMEIEDLKVTMSESSLVNKIKSNETFTDKNKKFSRIKYEKFLLENNLTAPDFERRLKKQELKKNLFDYVSGGIKSPYFLNNKIYNNETKQIELDYFDLNNSYDKETTTIEIDNFIRDNEEKLKVDYINLSYTIIDPKSLIEIEEFNDEFFEKIDEIENSILNGFNINDISKKYNLTLVSKNNYQIDENDDDKLKEIYRKRNDDKIQLIDKNDYFLLFEITKINKILPKKNDPKFVDMVKKNLILKKKFDLHEELFKDIQDKKLDDNKFNKIAKSKENILNIKLNGISDYNIFDKDSVKLIYSLPSESFTLLTDKDNKIYLAKIKNISSNILSKDNEKTKDYLLKSNLIIINDIFSSYNLSLNDKYNVKTYEQTMDRVKNYFK
tara:strand:- start:423 stop:1844 length:1422 start_codon:yes stop_codon:yes gene_type:complete